MTARPALLIATLSAALLPLALTGAALAQQPATATFSAADIDNAGFGGADLLPGRSALTAKVQILLDRSGTSPGVIDGFKGGMSESAIRAFERRAGLPMDGVLDMQVWNLLQPYAAQPMTTEYTITQADAEGLVESIPTDYAEKARMSAMAYTSIAERLGERFHMDERFIALLNPGVALVPGATIKVVAPTKPIKTKVTRIIIDKATRRVAAYDANGEMVVDYPATVGSNATPSPSGNHTVVTVALDPNYTYNPNVNFKQGDNDKVLTVPPGPNGPVGNVWIDLSKPTYGIHGTPTPSQLFVNQSNGCVRLTNWDARELAGMVLPGVTRVEFLEPGVTIADVTGAAPLAVRTALPLARPPLARPPTIARAAAALAGPVPSAAATPATTPVAATAPVTGAAPVEGITAAAIQPGAVITTTLPTAVTGPFPDALQEDTTEPDSALDGTGADLTASDPLAEALSKALQEQGLLPPTDIETR